MQVCELTTSEAKRLAECEATIERGLESFHDVGCALAIIRNEGLYKQTHKTFADYCVDKWGFTDRHALRQIKAAETVAMIKTRPMGRVPESEREARPLTRIEEPEERNAAWQEVVATAPEGKITAKHVEEVVQRRTKVIADREVVQIVPQARMPGQTFSEEQKLVDQAMNLIRAANEILARCLKQHGFGERSIERIRDAAETLRTLGE